MAASPAGACGGLVGENGTIQLTKTTTLAAYHDGVERYVTVFQFTGEGEEVGSIIPLPDVPTDVVRGGDWTLQRLAREVAPTDEERAFSAADAATAAAGAEVLLETKIDALDITVLRGGGDEVGRWATATTASSSRPTPPRCSTSTPAAARSSWPPASTPPGPPSSGQQRRRRHADHAHHPHRRAVGAAADPVASASTASRFVEADVFLLTDDEPDLLAGGPGLSLERSEAASAALLDDLRSDVGMEWVPEDMWFTYLQVGTEARDLDYDLAISADDDDAADARRHRGGRSRGPARPQLSARARRSGRLTVWRRSSAGPSVVARPACRRLADRRVAEVRRQRRAAGMRRS